MEKTIEANAIRAFFSKVNAFIALPIVGVLSALGIYFYNEHKENNKREIATIEEKLNKFYYPLQAEFSASKNEWDAFRRKYGKGRSSYFASNKPVIIDGKTVFLRHCSPGEQWTYAIGTSSTFKENETTKFCFVSDTEIDAWVHHITAQSKGSKGRVEEIVLSNRHLIKDDPEMKEGIDLLMLHYTGYRDVVKRWESGDRSVMTSHINYPSRLPFVVDQRIKNLESKLSLLR